MCVVPESVLLIVHEGRQVVSWECGGPFYDDYVYDIEGVGIVFRFRHHGVSFFLHPDD